MEITQTIKILYAWAVDIQASILILQSFQCQLEIYQLNQNDKSTFQINIQLMFKPDQIQLHSQSKRLIVACKDKKIIQIYDYKGVKISGFTNHHHFVKCFWAGNSQSIFVIQNQIMYLFDLKGNFLHDFDTPKYSSKIQVQNNFVFSQDRNFLAICSRDCDEDSLQMIQKVIVYNSKNWQAIASFPLHSFMDSKRIKWISNYNIAVWDSTFQYILAILAVKDGGGQIQSYTGKENNIFGIHNVVQIGVHLILIEESCINIIKKHPLKSIIKFEPKSIISTKQLTSLSCYRQSYKLEQGKYISLFDEITQAFNFSKERRTRKNNNKPNLKIYQTIVKISLKTQKYIACVYKSYPKIIWIYESNPYQLVSMVNMKSQILCFEWSPHHQILCFLSSKNCFNFWTQNHLLPINLDTDNIKINLSQIKQQTNESQFQSESILNLKWISQNKILASFVSSKDDSELIIFKIHLSLYKALLQQ